MGVCRDVALKLWCQTKVPGEPPTDTHLWTTLSPMLSNRNSRKEATGEGVAVPGVFWRHTTLGKDPAPNVTAPLILVCWGVTVAKGQRPDGWNSRHLFSCGLGGRKSKVSAWLLSLEKCKRKMSSRSLCVTGCLLPPPSYGLWSIQVCIHASSSISIVLNQGTSSELVHPLRIVPPSFIFWDLT